MLTSPWLYVKYITIPPGRKARAWVFFPIIPLTTWIWILWKRRPSVAIRIRGHPGGAAAGESAPRRAVAERGHCRRRVSRGWRPVRLGRQGCSRLARPYPAAGLVRHLESTVRHRLSPAPIPPNPQCATRQGLPLVYFNHPLVHFMQWPARERGDALAEACFLPGQRPFSPARTDPGLWHGACLFCVLGRRYTPEGWSHDSCPRCPASTAAGNDVPETGSW